MTNITHYTARQGEAWLGVARHGMARQGKDSREKSLLYIQT